MKIFIDPEIKIIIFESENVVTSSGKLEGLNDLGDSGVYRSVNMEKILDYNESH